MLNVENIRGLVDMYGPSFYYFNAEALAEHYCLWKSAFSSVYPHVQLAYSYKTNYLPFLCNQVRLLGGLAEVVSNAEYQIANKIGVPNSNIIFNGPMKSVDLSTSIILSGGIVNVDSYSEAKELIGAIRKESTDRQKIGIRCNFKLSENESRFGIPVASSEFNKVLQLFRENDIQVGCLHCHMKGRSLETWHIKAETMLDIFDSVIEHCSPDCCINLGGGVPALIDCANPRATAEQYAEAIAGVFRENFDQGGPTLILEPGTALAAPSMAFITTAIAKKVINERCFVTLAASCHNLGSTQNRNPRYLAQIPMGVQNSNTVLCGYTCLEDDLICEYTKSVNIGDILVFKNVGAYSLVMKPPFIMPNFPILSNNNQTGEYAVLRKAEDISAFCTEEELACEQ